MEQNQFYFCAPHLFYHFRLEHFLDCESQILAFRKAKIPKPKFVNLGKAVAAAPGKDSKMGACNRTFWRLS